ncbi:MAG: restriction endonuclease subunit S [Desulfobulbaceae bacterium]|jgi:type I restriction enzyme S subunit
MEIEWKCAQLGDIASTDDGAIAIGPFGSRMKADVYVPEGVPVIRGTNISKGKALKGDWVYVPDDFANKLPNCLVKAGDLVFPHRGSIGEVALIEPEFGKMILSSSMMKFRPNPQLADSRFLYYFFRSPIGRTEILKFSSQVGTPGIGQPLTSLRQFAVKLPPLTVQKAIAHILGSLDDKIELNQRMNETLEAMAQALFKSWFIDFDPVIDNALAAGHPIPEELQARAALRESLGDTRKPLPDDLRNLFPGEFEFTEEMGWIPKGWDVTQIGELLELAYGKALAAKVREPGPYPVYGSGGIGGYHKEAIVTGPGIVVGRKGTVGSVYWEPGDFFPIDTVFFVKPKKAIPLYWIYQNLLQMDIASLGADSAVPGVNRNAVHARKWLLPEVAILDTYWLQVQALIQKRQELAEQINTLQRLRDTLLPKLLSGEIHIPEAEKLVEVAV